MQDITHQELPIAAEAKMGDAVVCGYPDEKPNPKEKRLKVEFFK